MYFRVIVELFFCFYFFFFKQKTAYEMRISDWSSDVCSSDLSDRQAGEGARPRRQRLPDEAGRPERAAGAGPDPDPAAAVSGAAARELRAEPVAGADRQPDRPVQPALPEQSPAAADGGHQPPPKAVVAAGPGHPPLPAGQRPLGPTRRHTGP